MRREKPKTGQESVWDYPRPPRIEPTDDPARAARRIMTDDGFNTGILYSGERSAYAAPRPDGPVVDAAHFEAEFEV